LFFFIFLIKYIWRIILYIYGFHSINFMLLQIWYRIIHGLLNLRLLKCWLLHFDLLLDVLQLILWLENDLVSLLRHLILLNGLGILNLSSLGYHTLLGDCLILILFYCYSLGSLFHVRTRFVLHHKLTFRLIFTLFTCVFRLLNIIHQQIKSIFNLRSSLNCGHCLILSIY